MSTKFFTNDGTNTLLQKFAGVFANNKDIRFFDALIGYFRTSGYFAIRPHLEHVPSIRILVGINVDEIMTSYHSKGLLFHTNPDATLEEFMKSVKADVEQANYSAEVENGILQFIADVASKKIEIRAHPTRRLHAKIYIFRPEPFNEHKSGHVITGSSNLTEAGLGTTASANYEFNVLLNDYADVKFATEEFEKLWLEGVAVLPADINKLKSETYLNDTFTPYELYIKFLIEYFGRGVEFDPSASDDLPAGFKRLAYQVDAVNQGFDLLRKHNGFFLADVVGLGKTIIAIQIAKKFFYSNGYPTHVSRTLVVVPPATKDSWTETIEKFQLHNVKIITNGSLHKVSHPEIYDLVIIDEAHKFRNDTADMYAQLQRLCKTPVLNARTGMKEAKKVILVSATPLNNTPEDIYNLVLLFQDGKDSSLEISNLRNFFAYHIETWKKAKKQSVEESRQTVKGIYEDIRCNVITPLTVRRTRTDLQEQQQYRDDLIAQNISFPDVEKPCKIFYPLDPEMENLYDLTMRQLAHSEVGLTYNRYRAIQFLRPTLKAKYQHADMVSSQLAKIMKLLLIKRLDSSFHAFRSSLSRFRDATDAMVRMFEAGRIFIAPNEDVSQYVLEGREDELVDLLTSKQDTDPTITICGPKDFDPELLNGLRADLKILNKLVKEWGEVTQDPKLDAFLERLDSELLNPGRNPSGKLVIFSESKETTDYLATALKKQDVKGILKVDSHNRHQCRDVVRRNFDANYEPKSEQSNEFSILITTEVLAEGVNLHRSNVVVNYDTPWNSTRLMQRLGRVNRIGSVASKIYNYVFYPTAKVDDDIELRKKAIMKLQAFHSALGEDSQIYSETEEVENFGLFDKDMKEDRDERLDFLMELRRFKADHPGEFRSIKNFPLRARSGRKDKTKSGATVCFIRNRRRDAFCFISPKGEIQDLSFVDCARHLRATESEKAVPLHAKHHEQVQTAVTSFWKAIQQELADARTVESKRNPQEQKAVAFLNTVIKLPNASAEEKQLCEAAIHAIGKARFQPLARDIVKLLTSQQKRQVHTSVLVEKLIALIGNYPLILDDDGGNVTVATRRMEAAASPDIIISESFS